ncbi:hypothetical protein [Bacillus xiapuensis]|uniref:Uncharacterized protein n=1 Tax=Bacillus xiapuensis TaxID=2014075 RepID=A0ABU6NAI9_9BACI|nr:hypothetical protein [Bacillus xiapuensis]
MAAVFIFKDRSFILFVGTLTKTPELIDRFGFHKGNEGQSLKAA